MKITLIWTPPSSTQPTSFVLGDSPVEIPITNFRVQSGRALQAALLFRSEAARFFERGNRHTTITFETTRQFADSASAEAFVLMHETQFPGQFLAVFTAGRSGTSGAAKRYLSNAVVESVTTAIIGCTTRHSYKITGGIMSLNSNSQSTP